MEIDMGRRPSSPVTAINESSLFEAPPRLEASGTSVEASSALPAAAPPSLPPVLAARPPLVVPQGISKTMSKAIACPTFFTGQYLQPERSAAPPEHFLTLTGREFHEWRKAYVNHLIETARWSDEEFRESYALEHDLSEDARALIRRDALEINPDSVYGCELFLSVDRDFEPLEHEFNREPGRLSTHPRFLLSGTIDLLLLEGRTATILDPKSGFSTTGVTDDEPAFYAGLVMAHFPLVEEVFFRWDFVRMAAVRRTSYTRANDFQWIQDRVRAVDALKEQHVERYNQGLALDANPFSGLCPYCQLTCPLRPRWEAGELSLAMPQKREDAVRLAQLVKVCEDVIGSARSLLIQWLDQDPEHELPLGLGFVASLRVDDRNEYPLVEALHSLGLDLIDIQALDEKTRQLLDEQRPAQSPLFDVPLARLHIGGLSPFCKTKKSRAGVSREKLRESLAGVAKRSAATTLLIRKPSQLAIEAAAEG
jgi:hypothetical protein